jgi:thiol-disulfide isomerase/thioredoxin
MVGLLTQAAGANPTPPARAVVGRITLKPGSDPGFELGNCSGFVVNNTRTLRRDVGVGHDGTFRIEGLPAGVYDLSLDALEGGKNGGVTVKGAWGNERSGVLAMVRLRFELPSAEDAATSAPLDLGPQEIEISRTVRVGREAPAFKCATLEGDEVGTRDWRGKYVLLDFWASWCGPCRLEMPHLKALYNEYGKDPRFVMVSLSLDKDMDKQEACVKENGMKWVQGILGDWSRDRISLKYGVRSIPSMFLLGPDGRIIEMSASGRAMHASVARALGKASR